jgi:hypothetical protein
MSRMPGVMPHTRGHSLTPMLVEGGMSEIEELQETGSGGTILAFSENKTRGTVRISDFHGDSFTGNKARLFSPQDYEPA